MIQLGVIKPGGAGASEMRTYTAAPLTFDANIRSSVTPKPMTSWWLQWWVWALVIGGIGVAAYALGKNPKEPTP